MRLMHIVFILVAIVIPPIVAREKRSFSELVFGTDELDLKDRSVVRLE